MGELRALSVNFIFKYILLKIALQKLSLI